MKKYIKVVISATEIKKNGFTITRLEDEFTDGKNLKRAYRKAQKLAADIVDRVSKYNEIEGLTVSFYGVKGRWETADYLLSGEYILEESYDKFVADLDKEELNLLKLLKKEGLA